ncbi:Nicotinamide/nicotinic acid mononucleotide adenylyltransferase 3 [Sparganum proliferum]
MISLDGGDKGPPRNGGPRKATPSDIRDRAGKSAFSHSAGVVSHPADSTQSTSSSLTSLDTVITLPQPPLELPFVSLTSPTIPNDSTPVLAARSLCALTGPGPSEHIYNPHHLQKRITSRLKTSRSAEAFSSSASLSSSPAEVDINGGILRQASTTSYSSTCSTCSSGLDQTDSRGNSCSSITIGSTSNSCASQSPSSASKENLSSCCSSSSSSILPPSAFPSSSSPPPIGAFESAPLATIAATTATTFSPCFVPVCTAFSGLPACSHRTVRSPSPRRESPISVTATEADSSLRQSVGVCMENPVVLETPCHRYSCCRCCSWFTAPEPVVLVACGSFNPITTMHLRLMELARDAIEKTWSFPTQSSSSGDAGSTSSDEPIDPARELCQAYLTRPPKRQIVVAGIFSPVSDAYAKAGLAPVESRCRLARLACATTSDWLAVDTWEASQPGWSPTRVVFEHLQARLNRLAELSSEEVDHLLARGPCPARPETVPPTTREKNKPVSQTVDSSDELPGIASDAWLCERLLDAQTLADQPGSLRPCRCFHREEHQQCQLHASEAAQACGSTGEPSASGRLPRARVKLVCGADLLQSFATPGLWAEEDMETLARDFGIICISRPESNAARLLNELDVLAKYEQNVILVTEWCQNGLSATLVRRALARGQSVRYLVPDAALEEIYAAGLYGARRRRLENPSGTESAARRPRLSRHAADCSFRPEPRPDGQVSQGELASKEEGQEKSASLQPGH